MKLVIADTPVYSLEELRLANEAVSLESFTTMNVPGVFKGLVKTVLDTFKFTTGFTDVEELIQLPRDQSKFLRTLRAMPYTSVGELQAFVPEGMTATYLEYLHVLLPVTEHAMGIQKDLLTPYCLFLAQFVSDKKFSTSTNDDKHELQQLEKNRENYYKAFGKLFGKESYKGSTKVKHVVERNGDWEKVFVQLNQCIKNLEAINRDTIKAQIQQCTDYIEIILKEFSKENDRKVSQEAAHRLSNMAYSIGKELELFSTTYYRTLALRGSVDNTREAILTALG
jgi:hypothetical protein